MPPRASSGPKVPDPKTRKLTDFWVRSENGNSSPAASQTSHSQNAPSKLPSPVKSAGTSKPGLLSSRTLSSVSNSSNPGPFPGSSFSHSSSPRKSGTNALSPSKGTPSPRKYIMIEDDENEEEPISSTPMSRKRAREPATAVAVSPKGSTSSASTPPNSSVHEVIDLTGSPPHKKRVLEPPNSKRNGRRQPHSRAASFPIVPNRHATPVVSLLTDDEVELLENYEPPKASSRSNPNLLPNNKVLPPPTPVSPVSPIFNAASTQHQSFEERTRAKIEEMKRKAEMRVNAAVATTSAPLRRFESFQMEESEDEDDEDFLEKLKGVAAAKKNPPVTPTKPSEMSRAKSPAPTAAELFSSSPLTELYSDDSPPRNSARRATVPAPSISKTSRNFTVPPPPKFAPSNVHSKTNAQETTVIRARAAMPLALAMLLDDKPKVDAAKEAKRKELLKAVEEDMKDLERRRIYGDPEESKDSHPLQEVDPSVTEMAIGGEQAQRINVLIAADNSATRRGSHWRPFWDEQLVGSPVNMMDTSYSVPALSIPEDIHPVIARLRKAILDNETTRISFLLKSRIVTSISADISKQLAPWLFKTASSCEVDADLAIAAEVSFCSLFSAMDGKITECPLQFSDVLDSILPLGPLRSVTEGIFPASVTMPSALPRDPITRIQAVGRLIKMIRAMSREGVVLCDPINTTTLLLLLYLEPSTQTETRRDISLTIDDLLHTISSHTLNEIRTQELDICKHIVSVTTDFRLAEKHQLLLCIFGGQSGARRFMRWLAVGMALPSTIQELQWDGYLQPPPLDEPVRLFEPRSDNMTPFKISYKTDYEELFYNVEIIGTILTDISEYQPVQSPHLEKIINGLDVLHNKILDSRAAFLDRTRAKDAIQRLKIRVYFQSQQSSTRAATIDSLFKTINTD